ncbi:hypothetical protein UlMin_022588 [Ulmus minor]
MDLEAQSNPVPEYESPTIFKKANLPVTLMFEDVIYKIKINKAGIFKNQSHHVEKIILKGLSGVVRPGEMLAMLGPSGSGKTTLLMALGGKLGGGGLTGKITYNGKTFSNAMKRNTGFVTQDDILYPHLTVTETLVYTALLRLPNSLTKAEKTSHAEAVISQLGLNKCKNDIIGSELMRGVSGGERKRVSIGQEMLINPSLLFLDEPTSGLDSTTAQRIVSTLWELAQGGRTIVMTIHQPSSRLFYMFHKVLLLSEGNTLYFGNGAAVMDYFAGIGYSPSVAMNPSDFLLDLANGVTLNGSQEDQASVKNRLIAAYKLSLYEKVKAEIQEVNHITESQQDGCEDRKFTEWPTTWCQQFSVLLRRGIKERRHQSFSGLTIAQVLFVSFLCGLLWWQVDDAHLQDQIGLLYFMSGFWGFFALAQAIFTFPQDRKMLAKERSSGMYRLSSYFIARTVGDLPMELILPTVFVIISYWMAGLRASASSFLIALVAILLCVLVSQGLGLALGALIMDLKSANTLGSVIMMMFLLTGGYYVQHVPFFVSWIQDISMSRYTYKLLLGSQYTRKQTFPCTTSANGLCLVTDYPAINLVGLDGQVVSIVALLIMLVGYRLIAYLALMRIGVTKR